MFQLKLYQEVSTSHATIRMTKRCTNSYSFMKIYENNTSSQGIWYYRQEIHIEMNVVFLNLIRNIINNYWTLCKVMTCHNPVKKHEHMIA